MSQLKKMLSLALALAMVLSLSACGEGAGGSGEKSAAPESTSHQTEPGTDASESAAQSQPEAVSVDVSGTSVAVIVDESEGAESASVEKIVQSSESYCKELGVGFSQVKSTEDSDEDRIAAVDSAVEAGSNVVILPGSAFSAALADCAPKYPEVKFIAIDVSAEPVAQNAFCIGFQEEVGGFMAGYMAVKQGYHKLAFLGSKGDISDERYCSGFLQGIDCAAMELGEIDNISVDYGYADELEGEEAVSEAVSKWFKNRTQVVFATGDYEAVAAVAAKADGKVIGADYDQSSVINQSGKDLTLTCVVKDPAAAVRLALDSILVSGTWESKAGHEERLGVVSATDDSKNCVGLASTSQWNDFFDEEEYTALLEDLLNDAVSVENSTSQDLSLIIHAKDHGSLK